MTFQLRSPFIQDFLKHPHGRNLPDAPDFVSNALLKLGQEVRGFQLLSDSQDRRSVRHVGRSSSEVCKLVEWAAGILSKDCDATQPTEALVLNTPTWSEKEPREALLGIIEFWHVDQSPYLDADLYPPASGTVVPYTTIGNITAALGIAILDRLLIRRTLLTPDQTLAELGAAWQCAFFAGRSNHFQILKHFWELQPRA